MSSDCRQKASQIHYAREQLKESLAISPVASLKTLKSQEKLLKLLGVDVNELEQASHSLIASMSAPTLRPKSAGVLPVPRVPVARE